LEKGDFSTPREIAARMSQGSILAPVMYSLYTNDVPAAPGTHLAMLADDTCIYATDKHERHVHRKLQRDLTTV
jgi:hypothetical protein